MKSKLTLRMNEDVKERAKEVARERGTSLSALVEDYFLLLSGEGSSDEGDWSPEDCESPEDGESAPALTPRLKEVHEHIGSPPPEAPFDEPRGDLTEDERQLVKAASEKHA